MSKEKLLLMLDANIAAFKDNMEKAGGIADKVSGRIQKEFKLIGQVGKSAAIGAGALTASIVAMTKAAAENAKELKNNAVIANESVERFQELEAAYKTVNMTGQDLADITRDIKDRVGDFIATGGGPLVDLFDTLGEKTTLTAEKLQGMSGSDALQAVKNEMDRLNVSAEEQVFVMESLASNSSDLIPLYANQGQKLNELTSRYRDLNVSLSETDITQLTEAGAEIDRVFNSIKNTGSRVLADFSDEIISASKVVLEFVKMFDDLVQSGALEKGFEAIVGKFDGYKDDVEELAKVISEAFGDELGGALDATTKSVDFIIDAFENMPENIRAFIQIAVVELAAFVDKVGAYSEDIKGALTFWNDEDDIDLEKRLEAIGEIRDASIAAILDDKQAAIDAYNAKIEKAKELLDAERGEDGEDDSDSTKDKLDKEQELIQSHIDRMTEAKKIAQKKQQKEDQKQEKEESKLRDQVVKDSVGALDILAERKDAVGKAAFAAQKGYAIAETYMNTQTAAMRALADLGPIAGGAAAAAIVASGLARISAIMSTTPEGGTGGEAGVNIPGGGATGTTATEPETEELTLTSVGQTSTLEFTSSAADSVGEAIANWLNGELKSGRVNL